MVLELGSRYYRGKDIKIACTKYLPLGTKIPPELTGWKRLKWMVEALPKDYKRRFWILREPRKVSYKRSRYVTFSQAVGIGSDLKKRNKKKAAGIPVRLRAWERTMINRVRERVANRVPAGGNPFAVSTDAWYAYELEVADNARNRRLTDDNPRSGATVSRPGPPWTPGGLVEVPIPEGRIDSPVVMPTPETIAGRAVTQRGFGGTGVLQQYFIQGTAADQNSLGIFNIPLTATAPGGRWRTSRRGPLTEAPVPPAAEPDGNVRPPEVQRGVVEAVDNEWPDSFTDGEDGGA